VHGICLYIDFHHTQHPTGLGATDIAAFLHSLANRGGPGVESPIDRIAGLTMAATPSQSSATIEGGPVVKPKSNSHIP
jgi:hypothetical protein